MKVEMKLTGVDGLAELLRSLPPEALKRGGPARAALRKGAVVILRQEAANLRIVTANATSSGKAESTGLLLKSLTIKRSRDGVPGGGEKFLVTTKRLIYPRKSGKAVSVRKTGSLLEHGSSQQPAEVWVRTAVGAKGGEAANTVISELAAGIDKIVQKLEQQNRGR